MGTLAIKRRRGQAVVMMDRRTGLRIATIIVARCGESSTQLDFQATPDCIILREEVEYDPAYRPTDRSRKP